MLQTVHGIIDKEGKLLVTDDVALPKSRRVLITILDEPVHDGNAEGALEDALLSQAALARDWERPEEEEAWSHLGRLPSL